MVCSACTIINMPLLGSAQWLGWYAEVFSMWPCHSVHCAAYLQCIFVRVHFLPYLLHYYIVRNILTISCECIYMYYLSTSIYYWVLGWLISQLNCHGTLWGGNLVSGCLVPPQLWLHITHWSLLDYLALVMLCNLFWFCNIDFLVTKSPAVQVWSNYWQWLWYHDTGEAAETVDEGAKSDFGYCTAYKFCRL